MVGSQGDRVVLKRFVVRFVAFVGLIVPTALLLAMLAAPAYPASPGQSCDQVLADAQAGVQAMQARIRGLGSAANPAVCNATRLYFLEVVKARAVTALCKDGVDRDRELDRLDADVEHINSVIAARCS